MKPLILVYSASDRYNFGDMLYPLVLEGLLKRKFNSLEIKFFALTKSDLSKDGAIPTQNYKTLQRELEKNTKKIVFVAGGDGLSCLKNDLFAHSNPIDHFFSKITQDSNMIFKISQKIFWQIRESKRKSIPNFPFHFKKDKNTIIVYNSVGGSRFFSKNQAINFLHNIDFCSVRSLSDYNIFASSPITSLAPDFITLLPLLFSQPFPHFTIPFNKYIFFQISKNAYLQNQSEVIKAIDLIYEKTNIPFILCPIGLAYEHEDFTALKAISSKTTATHYLLKRPHIKDTIHLLANASLYIGTSLHGVVVSMSYETPYIGMRFIEKVAAYLDTWSIKELEGCSNYSFLPNVVDKVLNDSSLSAKLKEQNKVLASKTFENFNFIYNYMIDRLYPTSPLVSVIVPNYNHAPYLRQRLDSIFNQTYKNFEVIILDDCSTDNSKEIIEEYRNRPQVSHVVYNEINSGSPFKQWAKGFELAQGEYIWIAESDDWAELNFLEEMVPILNQDTSLAFTFCESYWEYPEKTVLGRTFKKDFAYNGIDFIKNKQIFNNNIVNASSVLFRRQGLADVSNDYQNYKGSGDYILWSYLCEHGNLYYKANYLNHFRRHAVATTNKSISSGLCFEENFEIYKYFMKRGYVSILANYRIIDYELSQIDYYKDVLKRNGCYEQCKLLWKKELKTDNLFAKLLLFLAKKINEYVGLSLIAKIWKFLHLPDTNIRGRLFGKR